MQRVPASYFLLQEARGCRHAGAAENEKEAGSYVSMSETRRAVKLREVRAGELPQAIATPSRAETLHGLPAAHSLEHEWIAAAQLGDATACRELYGRYHRRIFNLAAYTLNDREHAEDVAQNVFMKAFRSLPRFRFESSFATWLYRITVNECRDVHRGRTKRMVPLEALAGSDEERDADALSESSHARSEQQQFILREVGRLPAKMRVVVVLRYIEELSYEEIAAVLGCAAGTVASRLNRALAELASRLEPIKDSLY
jgi:RNA polymerase sigma-70 factor, ECF subfamily